MDVLSPLIPVTYDWQYSNRTILNALTMIYDNSSCEQIHRQQTLWLFNKKYNKNRTVNYIDLDNFGGINFLMGVTVANKSIYPKHFRCSLIYPNFKCCRIVICYIVFSRLYYHNTLQIVRLYYTWKKAYWWKKCLQYWLLQACLLLSVLLLYLCTIIEQNAFC